MCVACSAWSKSPLCSACQAGLAAAPTRRIAQGGGSGLLVGAAYRHEGPARCLVHALKYHGCMAAAELLAPAMAARLPEGAAALVPVPRARLRVWRHGIDPAGELARRLSRLTGLPVVAALRPALWWPRHAGRSRADRGTAVGPRFSCRRSVHGAVLVDDVLTTGSTLAAAAAVAAPVMGAVTATAAGI